jgi:Flp pilus assembly protein TadD/ADP-ribose pyrophosphatase YjhB (NUDIX family)/energy-coupling factor transporter ATP-binding protein EcfA2
MTLSNPGSLLAYNPDLVAKDDLIRSFVARRPLLDRLVEDIRRETGPGSAQHHLVIGQRGTGKTTLLRRLAYAVHDSAELSAQWLPIVFPEEQYNVTDLSSFWLNCVDALGDVLDQQGRAEQVDALDRAVESLSGDPAKRRENALRLLVDTAESLGKRLILLVDNIDIILDRIGQDQEWDFRRALQEQGQLLLVGASSRMLEQAHQHGRAFYEFFRIHELSALTDDETLAVLRSLALQHGADALSKLLDENPGRVRAMRLLTGGSPRTIVLLFKVLLQAPDGELEADLQQLLDHYTPLYKARFDDLPAQAQLLVDAIAVSWDPITAGDLAELVHLPVNVVSAQLKRLEQLGVTERTPWFGEKKNAFQVAERFFNIWYLMRGSRRVRRRLVWFVKFLQVWFTEEELRTRAQNHLSMDPCTGKEMSYGARSFAYAEAVQAGPLRTALEYAGLRAYLDDKQLRNLVDLSDLPPELSVKKERMELLRKLREQVLGLDLRQAGIDTRELWDLLGGSPHYTLSEKQRIASELGSLTKADAQQLMSALRRAKLGLLSTYRSHAAVVEKLYEELAGGEMDEVYDWRAARACAELPGCRLLPYIGVNARISKDLAATPVSESELGRAEATLTLMAADSLCMASGFCGLGNLLTYRRQKHDEAEAAYKKAIDLDPTSAYAWNNLGRLFEEHLGRFAEAEAAYRKAIELDPTCAYPWNSLGSLLADHLGRFAEAEAAYRKAIELDPTGAYPWNNLGILFAEHLGRFAEAEASYRKAIELDSTGAHPWNGLGVLMSHLGRFADAEAAYNKAIELDQKYPLPHLNLGLLLEFKLNRAAEAGERYLGALRLDPSDDWSLERLRSVCSNLATITDQGAAAEQLARQGLGLRGDDPGLQAALAQILVARGAWDEARSLVESWARQGSADEGGIALVRAIVAAGRHKEALVLLKKADADERLRPLYLAVQAVEAGSPDYLRRAAPEMRAPALSILKRIAPRLGE